jgi:hypothetical protein
LKKKFQVDIISHLHVNIKPTIWGKQFKQLGNDVLISITFASPPAKESFVKFDGKLISQPFDVFQEFLKYYGNSYLANRKHKNWEHSEDDNCPSGKLFTEDWYDFGGTGSSLEPQKMIANHPACFNQKQGSFFDNLPCPCSKLAHGFN